MSSGIYGCHGVGVVRGIGESGVGKAGTKNGGDGYVWTIAAVDVVTSDADIIGGGLPAQLG